MNVADLLIAALKNQSPAVRVETLRILALVEEPQALPALRTLAGTESDADVLNTVRWAGDLIVRAARNGYNTESAMVAYFRFDYKPDENQEKEDALLQQMQHQMDMDMIQTRRRSATRQTLGRGLMFGALGLIAAPAPAIQSTLTGGDVRLDTGNHPIVPQRPTDSTISAWTRQLRASDPKTRRQAATELLGFNNPAALPHLGYCFALAAEEPVRMEAQRVGKLLYFNWYYWAPKEAELRAGRI